MPIGTGCLTQPRFLRTRDGPPDVSCVYRRSVHWYNLLNAAWAAIVFNLAFRRHLETLHERIAPKLREGRYASVGHSLLSAQHCWK